MIELFAKMSLITVNYFYKSSIMSTLNTHKKNPKRELVPSYWENNSALIEILTKYLQRNANIYPDKFTWQQNLS